MAYSLADILRMEEEQGLRPDLRDVPVGYVWCNDPDCPVWHRGNDGCFWNHVHPWESVD